MSETVTKAFLTLHIETSKGVYLEETFSSYAELFDFVTTHIMGNCDLDGIGSQMIEHSEEEWKNRLTHYKGSGAVWKSKPDG